MQAWTGTPCNAWLSTCLSVLSTFQWALQHHGQRRTPCTYPVPPVATHQCPSPLPQVLRLEAELHASSTELQLSSAATKQLEQRLAAAQAASASASARASAQEQAASSLQQALDRQVAEAKRAAVQVEDLSRQLAKVRVRMDGREGPWWCMQGHLS